MYRFVEHTAELEVELEADSAEAILEEAVRMFAELVGPGHGERVELEVSLEASDLPALLAVWIEELVFLSETEKLIPESTDVAVSDCRVSGVLRGRRGRPRPIVKAVTLHRLHFQQIDGVWRGRVVLEV
jgi:SHS2 domain-containing protein